MRSSVVRAKLRRRVPVVGIALAFPEPALFELASLFGFDFLWLDLEHHAVSVQRAAELMRAARVGRTDVLARPAKGEFMRMQRLLEFGAHGIMYPRCDSADEAREVVRWMKFAPEGTRGVDSGNPDNPFCLTDLAAYLKQANDETWLVVQIEDPRALERADEIAAVEGVDVLMLGAGDFSVLSGVPGQIDHPRVDDALRRVAAAAERYGKAWGTPAGSPARLRELLDRGAGWVNCGCDLIWIKDALEATRRDLESLGLTLATPWPGSGTGAAGP